MKSFDQAVVYVNGKYIKLTPTQQIYSPKEWLKVKRERQRHFFENLK